MRLRNTSRPTPWKRVTNNPPKANTLNGAAAEAQILQQPRSFLGATGFGPVTPYWMGRWGLIRRFIGRKQMRRVHISQIVGFSLFCVPCFTRQVFTGWVFMGVHGSTGGQALLCFHGASSSEAVKGYTGFILSMRSTESRITSIMASKDLYAIGDSSSANLPFTLSKAGKAAVHSAAVLWQLSCCRASITGG